MPRQGLPLTNSFCFLLARCPVGSAGNLLCHYFTTGKRGVEQFAYFAAERGHPE